MAARRTSRAAGRFLADECGVSAFAGSVFIRLSAIGARGRQRRIIRSGQVDYVHWQRWVTQQNQDADIINLLWSTTFVRAQASTGEAVRIPARASDGSSSGATPSSASTAQRFPLFSWTRRRNFSF